MRTKAREQAALIDRLQRRLGEGLAVAAAVAAPVNGSGAGAEEAGQAGSQERQMERLRESLSEAEQTLHLARTGAPAEADRVGRERESAHPERAVFLVISCSRRREE